MAAQQKGILIIINQYEDREGSEHDVQRLRTTFEGMNAIVEIWQKEDSSNEKPRSCSCEDIREKMDELRSPEWRKKFEQCDYVALFVGAYGYENDVVRIIGNDGRHRVCSLAELILRPFLQLPALADKLKWVIVQASRGSGSYEDGLSRKLQSIELAENHPETLADKLKWVIVQASRGAGSYEDGLSRKLQSIEVAAKHPETTVTKSQSHLNNYVIAYATSEGAHAYRFEHGESIFVLELCNVLQNNAKDSSLMAMLDATAKNLTSYKDIYQAPQLSTNLQTDFSFQKGLIL